MPACSSSPTDGGETPRARRGEGGGSGWRARVRRFVHREHDEVSLRQALLNGLWQGLVIPVVFGAAFVVASQGLPEVGVIDVIATPHEEPSESDVYAERVRRLIDAHDCWVGSAPAEMEGRVPGHAVVTWPGDTVPSYGGLRAVTVGLGHRFEKRVPGFVPHAFCR